MATWYRTTKGSHRHADAECANQRRRITAGDIAIIPADQVADWTPCQECSPTGEITARNATASGVCSGTGGPAVAGSYHPKRIQKRGTCPVCAATVAMTSTLNLRKH